jgi:hypothetical protein
MKDKTYNEKTYNVTKRIQRKRLKRHKIYCNVTKLVRTERSKARGKRHKRQNVLRRHNVQCNKT